MTLESFANWLQATSASDTFRHVTWIIPAVQSVHILSIAILMSSCLMLDFRLLQIFHHPMSVAKMAQRFIPWVWGALVVLALTGSLLIVAEPQRELGSPAFWFKMKMILLNIPLMLVLQFTLRKNVEFWSISPGRRNLARVFAVVSFLIWMSVVAAGRWIAYWQAPV